MRSQLCSRIASSRFAARKPAAERGMSSNADLSVTRRADLRIVEIDFRQLYGCLRTSNVGLDCTPVDDYRPQVLYG